MSERVKTWALVFAFLLLVGCTQPEQATDTLAAQGFSEIEVGGYAPFACSEDDAFKTAFEATSPNGQRVRGAVCSGVFKGATVRITGTSQEHTNG